MKSMPPLQNDLLYLRKSSLPSEDLECVSRAFTHEEVKGEFICVLGGWLMMYLGNLMTYCNLKRDE